MNKLIIVGTGIKSLAHLTQETLTIIKHADKVLYLVNENNLKEWIEREACIAESLEPIYFADPNRVNAYTNITSYILEEYKGVKTLCVVLYGHPTVFAQSALDAVRKIREQGGDATVLPAISSLDCLFSDLQINPGDAGCFFTDATALLLYDKKLDISNHVILFQIFNLGRTDTKPTTKLGILVNYLRKYYLDEQPVCLYQAAILPMQKPVIEWIEVEKIRDARISPVTTLYIPPATQSIQSEKYRPLLIQ